MWIRDLFGSKLNIQQAKSGKIIIPFGNRVITLSYRDAIEFSCVYEIDDFDHEAFLLAYERPQNAMEAGFTSGNT
jgi:hypothetical protein